VIESQTSDALLSRKQSFLCVLTINKRSNNFDERPHRCLITPRGGEWIRLTLTPSNTWFHGPTLFNPKRHLDRFTGFCTSHPCVQHTDTDIHYTVTSVAIGHIYAMHALWPKREQRLNIGIFRLVYCWENAPLFSPELTSVVLDMY